MSGIYAVGWKHDGEKRVCYSKGGRRFQTIEEAKAAVKAETKTGLATIRHHIVDTTAEYAFGAKDLPVEVDCRESK